MTGHPFNHDIQYYVQYALLPNSLANSVGLSCEESRSYEKVVGLCTMILISLFIGKFRSPGKRQFIRIPSQDYDETYHHDFYVASFYLRSSGSVICAGELRLLLKGMMQA